MGMLPLEEITDEVDDSFTQQSPLPPIQSLI